MNHVPDPIVSDSMEFSSDFEVMAGAEVVIYQVPRHVFRGTRLRVLAGRQFTLLAVVVGCNTQTDRDAELSLADGFVNLQMQAAMPGITIALRLRNDGSRAAAFTGDLLGMAIQ